MKIIKTEDEDTESEGEGEGEGESEESAAAVVDGGGERVVRTRNGDG